MMKNYFEYNSHISSIELAQAIASPIAPGPFAGFSSAKIIEVSGEDPILRVSSKPSLTMEGQCNYLESIDNIVRRNISKLNTGSGISSSYINFGCIARDGSIHTSDQDTLEVTIQGEKGLLNEVLLFAKHIPVTEKIENPITFIAEWNTNTSISFYDLYKKALDPTYSSNQDISDPTKDTGLTYDYLNNQLKVVSQTYSNQENALVFIGAYGIGINRDYNTPEKFALVPYFSKFPIELNYNTHIHSLLFKSISYLQKVSKSVEKFLGTIEMWAGKELPNNYRLCDGSELSIVDYPELYQAIGNTFNNAPDPNGVPYTTLSGHFRLPDLRCRFVVGYNPQGDGSSKESNEYSTLGIAGGSKEVTLTSEESGIGKHSHKHDHIHKHIHSHYVPNGVFSEGYTNGHETGRSVAIFTQASGGNQIYHFSGIGIKAHDGTSHPSNMMSSWTDKTSSGSRFDNADTEGPVSSGTYTDNKSTDEVEAGAIKGHENRPPYYVLAYIMRVKF